MYLRAGYPDPEYVAKYVDKFAKKSKKDYETCKILDLACGTGLVGRHLSKYGFKNIYGLDISEKML